MSKIRIREQKLNGVHSPVAFRNQSVRVIPSHPGLSYKSDFVSLAGGRRVYMEELQEKLPPLMPLRSHP